MNDALKIQISAFVDGELPDNERELLLRRLCQDKALRVQVQTYLSIGRAVRGEVEPAGMAAMRARISAELGDGEVDVQAPSEIAPSRFMRPIAGVAVAAAVAVMALIGLRQLDPAGPNLPAFDDLQAIAIEEAPSYTQPPADEFMSDRPSDRLRHYFVRHGLNSPNLGSRLTSVELRGDELETSVSDDAEDDAASGAGQPQLAPASRDESSTAQ